MKKEREAIIKKATAKRARRARNDKKGTGPKSGQGFVGTVKNLAQSAVNQTIKLVGG